MRETHYIPTLDGWRAVAILLVLLQHSAISLGYAIPLLSKLGPHGVQVFFVLSGFLITTRLVEDDLCLSRFYIRRVFRILPLVCLFLSVLLLLHGRILVTTTELISSLLFVRNFTISSTLAANGQGLFTLHFWSLAVEEQFYLLWPPIVALAGVKLARTTAIVGVMAVFAWRVLCTYEGSAIYSARFAWYLQPEFHFDGLLLGCSMALYWPLIRERLRSVAYLVGPACALLWCTLVIFTPGFPSTLEAAAAAGLISATILLPNSVVGRFLESPLLRFLGRISYGLYVWQQLFLMPRAMGHPLGKIQALPFSLIALLFAAIGSFYLFERPMMIVGRRLASRRTLVPADESLPAGS